MAKDHFPRSLSPDAPAKLDQQFWLSRATQPHASESFKPTPRYSLRRPIYFEALINRGLNYSTPWRVRDLSLTGAFVEMDTAQFGPASSVEVVLRYRYKDAPIELRISATVARVQADGAALVFGNYDDQTYTDLANLLYAL
jgi:hypothetical protein